MINAKTQKEIDRLSDDLISNFAPPEFVPGCKVTAITDKDEYATDNGWIVAICGRHNNQRCRWTGQLSSIAINDYVDVLYYPSYKLFVVFGQGGTSAAQSGKYLLTDGSRDSTGQQDFTAGIKADTIAESTAAAGVTVDSVLLKDGGVYPNDNRNLLDRVSNFGNSIDYHFNNSTELNDFTWAGSPFSGSPTSSTVTESNWRVYSTTTANRYFAYQAVANPAVNFGITARIYKRSTISGFIAGLRVDDGTDANYYEAVLTDNTTYTGAGLSMVSVRDLNNPASLVTTPYPNTIISPEFVVLQINFSASISRFITYMGTMPLSSFLPGLNTSSTIDWTPARIGIFFTGSGSATYILGYDWITIV